MFIEFIASSAAVLRRKFTMLNFSLKNRAFPKRNPLSEWCNFRAFSLVEMLMALLVAALLMTALAPVITKKFGENITVSGTNQKKSTMEKSEIFDDPDKNGTDEYKFKVPNNAVNVRITMIGGGGAGGGATFGAKLISGDETNWQVPEGVTKLRVYMVGGGGGGGTGNVTTVYQNGTINAGYYDYKDGSDKGGGEYKNQKISDLILKKKSESYYSATYTVPDVDTKCANSRYNSWESNASSLVTSITACGAGGGGGENAAGGSGAYDVKSITLSDNYIIRVPGESGADNGGNSGFSSGAGGGGNAAHVTDSGECEPIGRPGTAGLYGGTGGRSIPSYSGVCTGTVGTGGNGSGTLYANGGSLNAGGPGNGGRGGYYGGGGGGGGDGCNYGGAGGGGPAIVMNSASSVLMIVSGGGGAGGYGFCTLQAKAGAGGGGGGPYGGGGGGGGSYGACYGTGGTGGGNLGKTGEDCGYCDASGGVCYCGSTACKMLSGSGGGGWPNGVSGISAVLSTYHTRRSIAMGGKLTTNVFGDDYCNGSSYNANGKPGAVRIQWNSIAGAIKCKYNQISYGGSGGGGGQVWIGEITVSKNQKLNFHVGNGGAGGSINSTTPSNDVYTGYPGGETYIQVVGGSKYSVAGGGGGSGTAGTTTVGTGGGKLNTNWSDWTGKNSSTTGGLAGEKSTSSSGAKGGSVYWMDGTLKSGASSVSGETIGNNAINYGTGGSGGGGVITAGNLPKGGGDGKSGFIYIEWGDANGGGGSSGEVYEKRQIMSAKAGATIEVTVGRGGIAPDIETDESTTYKAGVKGGNGEPTKIKIGSSTYSVKGGEGGEPGGANKDEHGEGGVLDISGSNSEAKTYPGMKGITGFGGMGGTTVYNAAADGEGLGGCGGSMVAGKCSNTTGSPEGKTGAPAGAGGGGGSVALTDSKLRPYKGGNGANGIVIIEWEEYLND